MADLDKFSGRLQLLADTVAVLGPALLPLLLRWEGDDN